MGKRALVAVAAILLLRTALCAGPIFQVSYVAGLPGVTCDSDLTQTAASAALDIGPCFGAAEEGQPYITAAASPSEVSIDGSSALFDSTYGMQIDAVAKFEGELTAVGGAGQAWLSIAVQEGGANVSYGELSIPSLGIDAHLGGMGDRRQYLLPISFGQAIGYSLSVANTYTAPQPDIMRASLAIDTLQVVDANGAPVAGAAVMATDTSSGEASVEAVPEPGTGALLLAACGLGAVCRRRRGVAEVYSWMQRLAAPSPGRRSNLKLA